MNTMTEYIEYKNISLFFAQVFDQIKKREREKERETKMAAIQG